jgi:hypothetical protein
VPPEKTTNEKWRRKAAATAQTLQSSAQAGVPALHPLDLKLTLTFSILAWERQSHQEATMETIGKIITTSLMALSLASGVGVSAMKQGTDTKTSSDTTDMKQKFYCNTKALSAAERVRHEALTKKLLAMKKATVEMEKGYEFQYSPADVTVAEVAEWVAAESKCCAFFDFHIDLENAGTLICLRLTGTDGVKPFIRAEFGVK